MGKRDPVEERSEQSRDLYDVATWEPRTALDRLAVAVHRSLIAAARVVVVLLAAAIIVAQFLLGGIGATLTDDPIAAALIVLSVVPAVALAAYVYVADVTSSEPLSLVVGTFVLGVLFAGFAAIVNSIFGGLLRAIPLVGMIAFFYLVVGPVEETVKWLAVRLYAFRDDRFDAVVDGAVYGAAAGLGFATIENALYITRGLDGGQMALVGGALAAVGLDGVVRIIEAGGQITVFRALAGPGHVIYSSFAGYYLGLAKFNRDRAGPIVVKGLLIAAFVHATYNTLVGVVPTLAIAFTGANQLVVFFAFVVIYDGLFGYILYRKLSRYRSAYHDVSTADPEEMTPERTEFED